MRRSLILAVLLAPLPAAAREAAVSFKGAPPGLEGELRLVSTVAAAEKKFPSKAAIRRAAFADAPALADALRAAGYYRASVAPRVEGDKVVYEIDAGPLFQITGVDFEYLDTEDDGRPMTLDAAGVKDALGPDGARLERLQRQVVAYLLEHGYPKARAVSRHVDADLDKGEARAVFVFESGPRANFGPLSVVGDEKVAKSYVAALSPIEEGAPFQRSKLVKYRDQLSRSGLFGAVDIAAGAVENGQAPVLVTLKERKFRTIGAGASYSTVEGPGGRLFFEHRNFLGRGERGYIELDGSKIKQGLSLEVSRPLPRRTGSLFATASFSNEPTAAFTARTFATSGGITLKTAEERLELRAAAALETSRVLAGTTDTRTYFVSTPLALTWSSEDDLLNPHKGVRASLAVTPTTGSDSFLRIESTARSRLRFGPRDRYTLAGRTRFGATLASSLADLPANRRLFVGGGASVRGYGYQAVGPRDANGEPTGGLSAVEGATELRARVARQLEIAAFVDAGSVSSRSLPSFATPVFVGAGGGLRYLSPAGPIRIDVATPVNGRPGDRAVQIYISLGQPF